MSETNKPGRHKHYPDRPSRVLVRSSACRCGCGGLDPWHRGSYDRVVRAVRELSEPVSVLTRPYGSERAVALGTVQFPSGTKPVAFIFGQLEDGTVYPLGWVMLKETV